MSDSVFADTNVLVYLFDADAPAKQKRAREVLEEEGDRLVVSTQVLQEFYVTVTRKLGRPLPEGEAESATRELSAFEVVETDLAMVLRSISSSRAWKISLWDALIVEAARARDCARLLSEAMQHGRRFGSVRVENPFR
jgi:predicted nucleic acid-binding protein